MRGGFRKGVSMDPKKLGQQMKKMGISFEELTGVEEVIIKTADAELVFAEAVVTVMDTQGSKLYQITGTPVTRPRREPAREDEPAAVIAEGDVQLVMEQVGCSEAEARAALAETNGDLAEAILRLSGA